MLTGDSTVQLLEVWMNFDHGFLKLIYKTSENKSNGDIHPRITALSLPPHQMYKRM